MNLQEMKDEAVRLLERKNADTAQVVSASTPDELIAALRLSIMAAAPGEYMLVGALRDIISFAKVIG